jgi:hypothetical protein
VIISVFGTAGGVILGTFLGWALVTASTISTRGVFSHDRTVAHLPDRRESPASWPTSARPAVPPGWTR